MNTIFDTSWKDGLTYRLLWASCGVILVYLVTRFFQGVIHGHKPVGDLGWYWVFALIIPIALNSFAVLLIKINVARRITAFNLLLIIVYTLSFDVSYRQMSRPHFFSALEQNNYHWNFQRTVDKSFYVSPLQSWAELQQVTHLMPKDSRFFSDQYTSYHLASSAPLYAFNPKNHHWKKGVSLTDEWFLKYCVDEASPELFDQFIAMLKQNKVQFIVIRFRAENYRQSQECVYRQGGPLREYLQTNQYDPLFVGEKFYLYQLY